MLTRFLGKLRERLPSPAEFVVAFGELQHTAESAKQRPLIRYLLVRLDQHMRKYSAIDYDKMSIEHIASENPKQGESDAPFNVGRVGNLILVPESFNNEVLANKPFSRKKVAYKRAHLPMDEVLGNAAAWGATEIDLRTTTLATVVQDKVFRV